MSAHLEKENWVANLQVHCFRGGLTRLPWLSPSSQISFLSSSQHFSNMINYLECGNSWGKWSMLHNMQTVPFTWWPVESCAWGSVVSVSNILLLSSSTSTHYKLCSLYCIIHLSTSQKSNSCKPNPPPPPPPSYILTKMLPSEAHLFVSDLLCQIQKWSSHIFPGIWMYWAIDCIHRGTTKHIHLTAAANQWKLESTKMI